MEIGTMKILTKYKKHLYWIIFIMEKGTKMEYINKEAFEVITQKLKQGKRIEIEYNHQKDELKILEHKITRIKLGNK